jgi:hypothetical protein
MGKFVAASITILLAMLLGTVIAAGSLDVFTVAITYH